MCEQNTKKVRGLRLAEFLTVGRNRGCEVKDPAAEKIFDISKKNAELLRRVFENSDFLCKHIINYRLILVTLTNPNQQKMPAFKMNNNV